MDGFSSQRQRSASITPSFATPGRIGGINSFYKYDPPLLQPEDVVGLESTAGRGHLPGSALGPALG